MSTSAFTESVSWGGRPVARRAADAQPRGRVVVTGTISATETSSYGETSSLICVVSDDTGDLGLLFLGRRAIPGLEVGARCTVEGTARMGRCRLVLWNPLYRIEPPGG